MLDSGRAALTDVLLGLPSIIALCLSLAACEHLAPADRRSAMDKQPGAIVRPTSPSAERRGIALLPDFKAEPRTFKNERSLAITDVSILQRFTFAAVMEGIACPPERACGSADAKRVAALALFRQWWATQSTWPLNRNLDPACQTKLFDFPYCRRAEGDLAADDPFGDAPTESGFTAIGLFNRIDLADPGGGDCGEYRIVFARNSGWMNGSRRVLINFEAVLPNPDLTKKLAACRPLAEFWRDLSDVDVEERGRQLRALYLVGTRGIPAIVHPAHYGARSPKDVPCSTGQIRTNQFMQGPWMLREFQVVMDCPSCPVRIVPSRVAQNPYGGLFADMSNPAVSRFQDQFVATLPTLTGTNDKNLLDYAVAPEFNSAQSESCDPGPKCHEQLVETNYPLHLGRLFRDRLAKLLKNTSLTPKQAVRRAKALSCAGCHQLSADDPLGNGMFWPRSLGFVHVSEVNPVGGRYQISPALIDDFLPHRAQRLQALLDGKK